MRCWTVRFDGNTVRVGVRWRRELSALRRCVDFSRAASLAALAKGGSRGVAPVHLQTISAKRNGGRGALQLGMGRYA